MNLLDKIKFFIFKIKNSPIIRKIIIILAIGLLSIIGVGYWLYNSRYATTENAYVNADVVQVAAQVPGQISQLLIKNNQFVQKGQILFELNPDMYSLEVEKAQAQLTLAETQLAQAQLNYSRIIKLLKLKYESKASGDNAKTNVKMAIANVQLAKVNLENAKLNLTYTKVTAPTNGWISNLTMRVGDVIVANQALFALVSDNQYWVDANYKETALSNVRPGQSATIVLDMYPDITFHGIVESISDSSGSVFSLLPPQNAIGNWVKVTQRVPVKIYFINPDPHYPLRIGTTATVTIDTHSLKNKND